MLNTGQLRNSGGKYLIFKNCLQVQFSQNNIAICDIEYGFEHCTDELFVIISDFKSFDGSQLSTVSDTCCLVQLPFELLSIIISYSSKYNAKSSLITNKLDSRTLWITVSWYSSLGLFGIYASFLSQHRFAKIWKQNHSAVFLSCFLLCKLQNIQILILLVPLAQKQTQLEKMAQEVGNIRILG